MAVLERTLAGLRDAGTLSLLDVKRGDIGTTMAGYAQAYLSDGSPLRADAITVSPYLGYESLRPALDLAAATGRGVFVLTLTSNPEGPSVQHASRDGASVAASVVAGVARDNAGAAASGRLGSVGMVVGATVGSAVTDLGLDLAGAAGPLLAPGWARRAAPRPPCARRSVPRCPRCSAPAAGRCSWPGPTSARCATRHDAPPRT